MVETLLCVQQEATSVCLSSPTAFNKTTEAVHNKEVSHRDVLVCQCSLRADMSSLQHLNAFISERLTAAAVEIFGAVEKTLTEYQGEISRSRQEIEHLRTLVLWPQVTLRRSAAHQFSPHCCDKENSPECCLEEDCAPHVSSDHPSTPHIKEEHDQRADRRGPSCRQQSETTMSPRFVRGHKEWPSHLYRILDVKQTADIKAEPDGDDFVTTPSTREAEVPCIINSESSGALQETLIDLPQILNHEQDGPDEEQYTEQDWSLCQDHEDPDPHQMKVGKFTSSTPQEETDNEYELPLQSERGVFDEPQSSGPSHERTATDQTFYTAEEKRGDADRERCRVSQPFYSVNHSNYDFNTEGVVNGEWMTVLTPAGIRPKKRQSWFFEGRDNVGVEEDINESRERRHTCPVCAKRFKESSHLRDHVRIHTGEKPYRCKECGMNFRQSGALTLHMRIHTGERPYQCADCGRRFNRKGDMETHRVTHTGERPHLCVVCGKSFKRKSNLNTHLKTHAEDRMENTQLL